MTDFELRVLSGECLSGAEVRKTLGGWPTSSWLRFAYNDQNDNYHIDNVFGHCLEKEKYIALVHDTLKKSFSSEIVENFHTSVYNEIRGAK